METSVDDMLHLRLKALYDIKELESKIAELRLGAAHLTSDCDIHTSSLHQYTTAIAAAGFSGISQRSRRKPLGRTALLEQAATSCAVDVHSITDAVQLQYLVSELSAILEAIHAELSTSSLAGRAEEGAPMEAECARLRSELLILETEYSELTGQLDSSGRQRGGGFSPDDVYARLAIPALSPGVDKLARPENGKVLMAPPRPVSDRRA